MDFEKSKWLVNEEDFEKDTRKKENIITVRGGCGQITFWIQKSTGRSCVKKETLKLLSDSKTRKEFDMEVKVLAKYHHPGIVPFIGFYEREKGYIFIELAENGSLSDFIERNNKQKVSMLDDTGKLIISYGIAAALEFLHSFGVFHRDLKTLNILLDDKLQPLITDFGLAKEIAKGMSIYNSISNSTTMFMSPEFQIDAENAIPQYIDVYSYAITLYWLITGLHPFPDKKTPYLIGKMIIGGERPFIPDNTPSSYTNLIKKCWEQNPYDRPTFTEICDELESDVFYNDSIDKKRFNDYLKIIKPKRPTPVTSAAATSPITKLQPPIDVHTNVNPLKKARSKPQIDEDLEEVNISPQPPTPIGEDESPLMKLEKEAQSNYSTKLALANALFRGDFGPPDYEKAKDYFLSVANNKSHPELVNDGEYGYGRCLIKLNQYQTAAKYLLNHSIMHGNREACYLVAEMIYNNQIEEKNMQKMAQLYERAAESGHKDAIIRYSSLLLEGKKIGRNLQKANKFIKKGSECGIPEMMYKWALQLEAGSGVAKNIEQAMFLMSQASEFGCIEAQFDYGMHLLNGVNVERDLTSSLYFLKAAASSGHSKAMLWYSSLQIDIPDGSANSDKKAAQEFLEKLIQDESEIDAYAVLGQLFLKDGQIDKAIEVLKNGADKGSRVAMNELGHAYFSQAVKWYHAAADKCHSKSGNRPSEPVKEKVYHCNDCNMDVCEACARYCHKDHKIVFESDIKGFVCLCNGSH